MLCKVAALHEPTSQVPHLRLQATDVAQVQAIEGGDVTSFMAYWGIYPADMTLENVRDNFFPYLYGYATELAVSADGVAAPQKWYTLGRFSHEMCSVMPDSRTVYCSDDSTGGAFYKFVADAAGDLSYGAPPLGRRCWRRG